MLSSSDQSIGRHFRSVRLRTHIGHPCAWMGKAVPVQSVTVPPGTFERLVLQLSRNLTSDRAFAHQWLERDAMPTYEYRCVKCGHVFERSEHVAEHEKVHPQCPKCGSAEVEAVLADFFAKTSKKS